MIDFRDKHSILNRVAKEFPKWIFTAGIDAETRRYCIFVYDVVERGTNIPAIGSKEKFAVEVAGTSEKDVEVLLAKLALVCG